MMTIIAGNGSAGFVDGRGAEARFSSPHSVIWAPDGALRVADIGNARVRRIHDGKITTVAGTGLPGIHPTQLDDPAAVLAHDGLLWIADLGNHRITAIPLPCGQCDPVD